ncbi:hypothetical protein [Actinacidiphila acididurans]|uniref:Uncharacterized protein n=1 Tax=Actinacidiphila acididurans TaxID=2784346 RepID=A0ABS2U1P2_9ACTN|nr:hypothetical protein [Actinacidiphila acididurans]MBM9509505.1 hypothetical protein [Actinacidiphila acididurans]
MSRLSRRSLVAGALLGAAGALAGPVTTATAADTAGPGGRSHRVRTIRLATADGSVTMNRIVAANRYGAILGAGTITDAGESREGTIVWTGDRLVVPPLPPAARPYSVLDGAVWINDSGQLAGSYDDGTGTQHALVWDRYDAAPREVSFGRTNANATAVNGAGRIVGFGWDTMGAEGPLATPYFSDGGQAVSIDPAPGDHPGNHVLGFNDRGTVLMRYGGTEGYPSTGAFLWRKGETATNLNRLAGDYDLGSGALNAADQVVLGRDSFGEHHVYFFTSTADTVTAVLGPTDGSSSIQEVPRPLSDLGHVAGWYYHDGIDKHPFLWSGGAVLDLGTLGGPGAEPLAVNNLGQVAGTSDVPDGTRRAFLWRDGEPIAIDPPGGGYVSTSAAWLTDRGDVLGYADTADERHAVIWTVR